MAKELSQRSATIPPIAATVATLVDAAGYQSAPTSRHLVTASKPVSPDEGLALIEAYVEIKDHKARQAILDIVEAIARRQNREIASIINFGTSELK